MTTKFRLTLILSYLAFVHSVAWAQTQYQPTEIDYFGYTPMAEAVPLNPYGGNAVRVVHDLRVAAVSEVGLDWTRYNNTGGQAEHRLSSGWSHSFSWFLIDGSLPNGQRLIRVAYPDGNIKSFAGTTGPFLSPLDADYVTISDTAYTVVTADNRRVTFLKPHTYTTPIYATSLTDAKGNVTTLTYTTAGGQTVLSKVADPSGHYLEINYTVSGNKPYITSVVTSDGRSVSYSYSGSLLSSVSYPDGTTATYSYTSISSPNGTVYKVLTTAADVRADGIRSIRYDIAAFGSKNLAGFVTNVWNNADQSLVVQGNSNANGPSTPTRTLRSLIPTGVSILTQLRPRMG